MKAILGEIYMEKLARQSYGRNLDGSRRTAEQLIKHLGGASLVGKDGKMYGYVSRAGENSPSGKRRGKIIGTGVLEMTGDGKYNFVRKSPNRIQIARNTWALHNDNERDALKALRQNSAENFINRTDESINTGKPLNKKTKTRRSDLPSGRIPEVILGTGLLAMAGAKAYNNFTKKKKGEDEDERKRSVK